MEHLIAATTRVVELNNELTEMIKQRDYYKKACDQYSEDKMLHKLNDVTKQRDILKKALEAIATGEWGLIKCVDFIAPRALEQAATIRAKGGES